MDNLFKQTRARFSGVGQEKIEESGSGKDRKIPAQKTQPFKDKKKDQNWFRRQFSRQMSQDYDSNGVDQAIAVAAAAYAISSLNESGIPDQKQTKKEPGTSTITSMRKKEDATVSIQEPGQGSMRSSENPDSKVLITAGTDTKKPEKALVPAPSFRKAESSVDKQTSGSSKLGKTTSKPELAAEPAPTPSSIDKKPSRRFKTGTSTSKPDLPTTVKPVPLPTPAQTKKQNSTRPGMGKTQADIWEEAEIARIKERYDKQTSTILDWEDKRNKKAKRRLEKTQGQLDRKRAKAMEKFRKELQTVDQIAQGAKAKAEEKKRNDVVKVKEKANTIRRTGKAPKTCLCF